MSSVTAAPSTTRPGRSRPRRTAPAAPGVPAPVAAPGRRVKVFRHPAVGTVNLSSSSLSIDGMAEHRVVVYTPLGAQDTRRIERLRAIPDPVVGCPEHGRPLSEILREKAEQATREGRNAEIPLPR
ncbi:hypothetical protein ACIQCJ_22600 [Streptomyces sp. NPDC093221]|uniref:MmyB family transcriptional regulator n=1 Tax=Streptomyces sp. NPDC093221 TaxID=3366032 RepID=UPI003813BDBA